MWSKFDSYEDIKSTKVASSGIGFPSLLTLVFIVLKLCKVISWNWFWVLSPLIFSAGLTIVIAVVFLIIAAVVANNE